MIDTKAIRSKILDLAIRGKLTEQLPEDGTAEELYQQIQQEKHALIKSGKIKKEKPLPEIAEAEIPFEIPDNWKWVRLGDAFHVEMGQSPEGTSVSKDGDGIEFHQGKIFFGDKYINDSKQRTNNPTKIAEANSVLLCVRAPVGKVNITQRRICIGRGLSAITPISAVELVYLYYYLVTCEKAFADQGTGSTFSAINGEIIRNHLCPLPPLAEQKRIVEKIEQAYSILDTIDELQAQYANNLTVLKSKLIDLAIRGKLTEQLPEDGTAEELYQQIQEEKQALIKSGKIKKEKPLPEITEAEIPFEIPDNWAWLRWGNLSFQIQYGYNAPAKEKGDIKMVRITDIQDNKVAWNTVPFCDIEDECIDEYRLRANDILFARTGGTVGKSFLVKKVEEDAVFAGYLIRTNFSTNLNAKYMKYFMESRLYWKQLQDGTTATAQPNCNAKTLSKMIVPLPPLAEQKRIVDRLDKLLAVCEELK